MAVPVAAAVTVHEGTGTATPNVPSGVANGSLLIAHVFALFSATSSTGLTITPPSGWSLSGTTSARLLTTDTWALHGWYYKYATGADTGTYSFATSGGTSSLGVTTTVVRVTGGPAAGNPLETLTDGSNASPSVVAAYTPAGDDRLSLLSVWSYAAAPTTPSGWTQAATYLDDGNNTTRLYTRESDATPATGPTSAAGGAFISAFAATVIPASAPLTRTATGTLTLAGTATSTAQLTRTAAGSLTLAGAADLASSVARTATGSLTLAGSAAGAVTSATVTAAGTLTLSGTATQAISATRTATGGLSLDGYATRGSTNLYASGINGRYFVNQQGTPVYLRAETAWYIMGGAPADWPTYFADRQSRGINCVYVFALPRMDVSDATTWDGTNIHALNTAGNYATANSAWVARVQQFVDMAADYGMAVIMSILSSMGPMIDNTSEAAAWGTTWGNALKSYDNLFWGFGVDFQSSEYGTFNPILLAGYNALRATGASQPMSIQLYYDNTSSDNSSWANLVDFEMTYAYREPVTLSRRAYALNNGPVFFAEGNYEGENLRGGPATTSETYRRMYGWFITNGTVGHDYAKYEIYNPVQAGTTTGPSRWVTQLSSTFLNHQKAMADAINEVPWWKLVPDTSNTFLTSGQGTIATSGTQSAGEADPLESSYASAAVSPDGDVAIIYAPTSRAMTVSLSPLAAYSRSAYRVDPTTGTKTPITVSTSLAAPGNNAAGQSDWLYFFTASSTPPTVTATGGLTLSGTAAQQTQQARTASGSLSLSGSATQVTQVTVTATGTLSLSGTAAVAGGTLTRTATGTLTLDGTVASALQVTTQATGSLTLSGTAAVAGGAVTRTAAGSLDLAGSATMALRVTTSASSSLTLGGAALASTAQPVTASGSLTLSGYADADIAGGAIERTAEGELTLAGSATRTLQVVRSATSGLVLSGTVTAEAAGGAKTVTATGTLSLAGTADASTATSVTRTALGTLTLSGSVQTSVIITATATGSLSLSGTGQAVGVLERTAVGALTLSGVGVVGESLTRQAQGTMDLAGFAAAYTSEAPPIPQTKLRLKVRGAGYTLSTRSVED